MTGSSAAWSIELLQCKSRSSRCTPEMRRGVAKTTPQQLAIGGGSVISIIVTIFRFKQLEHSHADE